MNVNWVNSTTMFAGTECYAKLDASWEATGQGKEESHPRSEGSQPSAKPHEGDTGSGGRLPPAPLHAEQRAPLLPLGVHLRWGLAYLRCYMQSTMHSTLLCFALQSGCRQPTKTRSSIQKYRSCYSCYQCLLWTYPDLCVGYEAMRTAGDCINSEVFPPSLLLFFIQ